MIAVVLDRIAGLMEASRDPPPRQSILREITTAAASLDPPEETG
jgi:hypothetical protein